MQISLIPINETISQERVFKDLSVYFSENLSGDYHLSVFLQKSNQKLVHLQRSTPSEMKMSVDCNLIKNYI